MKPLPVVSWTPRAREDFRRCLEFVAGYDWGRPSDRVRDIFEGIRHIRRNPECNPVRARRRKSNVELRRQNAAQFVIVYVYVQPSVIFPSGVISLRAIRHGSVKNVLWGVRERRVPYGGLRSEHMSGGTKTG